VAQWDVVAVVTERVARREVVKTMEVVERVAVVVKQHMIGLRG